MNYQEFLQTLKEKVSSHLEDGILLQLQKVTKNNGVELDAFIMINPSINISPTIYILPYYHRYLEGADVDELVTDFLDTYQKNLPQTDYDISVFTDYEKAKHKIVMRLVNYKSNEELLKQIPHKRFLDLAVIYYCLIEASSSQIATILIHNHHLDYWNIDRDELHAIALYNTPDLLSYHLENMQTLLKEVISETLDISDDTLFPMFILTNIHRSYGASVLLYPKLLERLSDQFSSDFIILPSSVHEIILLPVTEETNLDSYNDLVKEVNETQLTDDEVLSDHAYYYSRKNRLLTNNYLS